MNGYKIYLTKSPEVADILYKHSVDSMEEWSTLTNVTRSSISTNSMVPEMYHKQGYHFCILEYQNLEKPKYEIVFA